jgi:hypothetical protein
MSDTKQIAGAVDTSITPDASEIFGDAPAPRFVSRPSLTGFAEACGIYRLHQASPAEDIRDALDLLTAEVVKAQLDAVDRATLLKIVRDQLASAGVKNAQPLVRAALAPTAQPTAPTTSGAAVLLQDPEPWSEPVQGSDLLETTAAVIRRYVVTTPTQSDAIALWVGMAYCIDVIDVAPFLGITSATMRAGKSTLCEVLAALTRRAVLVSSLTSAVVYRLIDAHRPTLIADEADTWLLDEKSELRGILNAGHTRETAIVPRCVGDDNEVRLYSAFCARVLSMIGRPPATIRDRSIIVELRRKTVGESVERLRLGRLRHELAPLQRQWRRWAADHADEMRVADPVVPPSLDDRAADCWRPLLGLADLAGARWPARARTAALDLSAGAIPEDESENLMLLSDIRVAFAERGNPKSASSAELIATLKTLPERPWADLNKGHGITPSMLARRLRGFGPGPLGLRTRETRIGDKTGKRWHREDFADPFSRYLTVDPQQPQQTSKDGTDPAIPKSQRPPDVADTETQVSSMFTGVVAGVADAQVHSHAGTETEVVDGFF